MIAILLTTTGEDSAMEEEEEDYEDHPTPLTFDEIEVWAAESAQTLRSETGADLPRLASTPLHTVRRVECVPLKLELPLGSLFYPCCGSDIEDALETFGSCVTDCHFADPYNPARGRRRRGPDLIPLFIPHIETVVVGGHETRQLPNLSCPVYSHQKDGLLTLIDDVPLLSVFYYRGDSYGEGGSNQRWLEPVLFHTVLARLLDGGLIATDGSNCGSGDQSRSVPWSPLCWGVTKPAEFEYARRRFLHVDELRHPQRNSVHVWQVTAGTVDLSGRMS